AGRQRHEGVELRGKRGTLFFTRGLGAETLRATGGRIRVYSRSFAANNCLNSCLFVSIRGQSCAGDFTTRGCPPTRAFSSFPALFRRVARLWRPRSNPSGRARSSRRAAGRAPTAL